MRSQQNWFHKLRIKVEDREYETLLSFAVFNLGLKKLSQCALLVVTVLATSISNADEPRPEASMAAFCKQLPRSIYQSIERVPFSNDWFQLYKVAPGVTAIYEPFQWQEVISYLIEGTDEALLFDSGNGIADISSVVEYLTSKPLTILNSHSHYDHVGGNFAFDKIAALDNQFSRNRQKGHGNPNIRIEVSQQALCKELPKGVTEDNHIGRPYMITDTIEDGHIFNLGGRHLEVVHVPGHTPDALVLIDRSARLMWTGDTFYSGPIWLYAPETDLEAYAKSIARLALEVPNLDMLLPAHNTPKVEPSVLVKLSAAFAELRAGKLLGNSAGDGTTIYEVPGEEFSFLLRDDMLWGE